MGVVLKGFQYLPYPETGAYLGQQNLAYFCLFKILINDETDIIYMTCKFIY